MLDLDIRGALFASLDVYMDNIIGINFNLYQKALGSESGATRPERKSNLAIPNPAPLVL